MSKLKYDIRDIRDQGLRVSHQLDHSAVYALLVPVGVEPADEQAHVEVDLTLSPVETARMGGGLAVAVRGRVSGRFTVRCARCLAPATVEVTEPEVALTFLPPTAGGAGREELTADDLDTFVHDGTHIDLEPVVREQLVLAIPITPLCDEDCKGICPQCGVDRNQSPCGCDEEARPAGPWVEALSRIKQSPSGS